MSSLVKLGASLSNGYRFANGKAKADEIIQGKNYYSAVLYQGAQISSVSNIASNLANYIPQSSLRIIVKTGSSVAPILGSGGCLLVAAVKQGHYDQSALALKNWVEKTQPALTPLIPQTLHNKTTQCCSHLADHMGKYMQGAVVTGAVALSIFEGPLIAGAMLTPVFFQIGESLGVVPTSIRIYTERYFPTLSQVGLLIGGNPFSQITSAMMLASCFPSYNQFVHHWVDSSVHSRFKMARPSLVEIDAPLKTRKNLSYDEILQILQMDNFDYQDFEFNPAHFSKWAIDIGKLPHDFQFDQFVEYFEAIDWTQRYRLLFRKFSDDERFISELSEKFPDKKDYSEKFDEYLTQLVPEGVEKAQFLAQKLKSQFSFFIRVCKNEAVPAGTQRDHLETIELASCILARLPDLSPIEREDVLLKLGVEAGEYCARGMRRACREILNGLMPVTDPAEHFELRIRQSLEQTRRNIFDHYCLKMIEFMKNGNEATYQSQQTTDQSAVAIAQDIHTQDYASKLFGLGFIPFSPIEKNAFGFNDLVNWAMNSDKVLPHMYRQYFFQLNDTIKDVGETEFNLYIQGVIRTNEQLTEIEKEDLIDKISMLEWDSETPRRFQHLMYVILGVLKLNPLREWAEISSSDAPIEEEPDPEDWIKI